MSARLFPSFPRQQRPEAAEEMLSSSQAFGALFCRMPLLTTPTSIMNPLPEVDVVEDTLLPDGRAMLDGWCEIGAALGQAA